jgi:hypothetical protein
VHKRLEFESFAVSAKRGHVPVLQVLRCVGPGVLSAQQLFDLLPFAVCVAAAIPVSRLPRDPARVTLSVRSLSLRVLVAAWSSHG